MSPEAVRLLKFAMDYPHTFHVFSPGNAENTKRALRRLGELGLVEIKVEGKIKSFRARPSRLILENEFKSRGGIVAAEMTGAR